MEYPQSLLENNLLQSYVVNAYRIYKGRPDENLLEKSKLLDTIYELSSFSKKSNKVFSLWMNFVAALHDENHVQLRDPQTLDPDSHYQTMKEERHKILTDMFKIYGVAG